MGNGQRVEPTGHPACSVEPAAYMAGCRIEMKHSRRGAKSEFGELSAMALQTTTLRGPTWHPPRLKPL